MTNIEEETIYNLTFYKGNINNIKYILVKSGVGKVNATNTLSGWKIQTKGHLTILNLILTQIILKHKTKIQTKHKILILKH